MRAESGFDPAAKSSAGALGVMQVMPSTAEAMSRKYDIPFHGAASLRDPATNMTFGQAYLERLRDTYFIGDSVIDIGIAYNAGLKRAEDWAQRYGDIDDPLPPRDPDSETRITSRSCSAISGLIARLDQLAPELEAFAGGWPQYGAGVARYERYIGAN